MNREATTFSGAGSGGAVNRSDAGFSLVELAVYIVLLGVISAIVAATVLGLFRSEKTVSSLTNAASQSQVFVSILNQDIRSARELAVRDGGTRVIASVASATNPITWSCVTWVVTGSGSERAITRNGKAQLDHVRQNGVEPFFASASGADAPQGKEGTLLYNFRAADSESGIVNVDGNVSMEAQGTLGAAVHCI